jgi:hypothetical protein
MHAVWRFRKAVSGSPVLERPHWIGSRVWMILKSLFMLVRERHLSRIQRTPILVSGHENNLNVCPEMAREIRRERQS